MGLLCFDCILLRLLYWLYCCCFDFVIVLLCFVCVVYCLYLFTLLLVVWRMLVCLGFECYVVFVFVCFGLLFAVWIACSFGLWLDSLTFGCGVDVLVYDSVVCVVLMWFGLYCSILFKYFGGCFGLGTCLWFVFVLVVCFSCLVGCFVFWFGFILLLFKWSFWCFWCLDLVFVVFYV